jgi:hypothetical protein
MRQLILCFALLSSITMNAQNGWTFAASGRYMFADEWDEIVRTYNFTRPNVEEQMNLFSFGWNVDAGYTFHKNNTKLSYFITAGFHSTTTQAFSSAAYTGGNEYQLRVSINCATLDAGLRYFPFNEKSALRKLFADFSPGFAVYMPRVSDGGELVEIDEDEIYRPFVPSWRVNAGIGVQLFSEKRLSVTPFLNAEYTAAVELTEFAAMVTGSYFPDLDDESRVLAFRAGIRLQLNKKQ